MLCAVTEYKLGFMKKCVSSLGQIVRIGFEWEDEDPLDHVIRQILPIPEYHDFEHIYIDILEQEQGERSTAQNRWFYITAPIYEIFRAGSEQQRNRRILKVIHGLSPSFNRDFIESGRQKLEHIIKDFSKSGADARFGASALQAMENSDWQSCARLILAVILEHLKQFAEMLGLSPKNIEASQLQTLAPLLPLRIATAVMLIYFQSDPRNKIQTEALLKLNENQISAILAAGFIAFYQEIDRYAGGKERPA
ncbi:MAG: hypothetical protein U5R06_00685 [candidate division KSB1 bacterium]|nr:hypothetical protein [candidate division KSB1 bacterium]